MTKQRNWNRDELLLALRLYCALPFGKLSSGNSEVIKLSNLIDRTPSAVSMKACNFASFDPVHQARGVIGLKHTSNADAALWEEFSNNAELVAQEAETVFEERSSGVIEITIDDTFIIPSTETETTQVVRARRVQRFFRCAVLTSYDNRCALTGIAIPELINASHIIPWKDDVSRRADPRNGIALNALHDRAFDRGFITIDKDHNTVVSERLRYDNDELSIFHRQALLDVHGKKMNLPERFLPDPVALEFHREKVFRV